MKLKLSEIGKAVSPAGAGFWVQVHDFTPENAKEQEKRGRLLAIVGVENVGEEETMKLVEIGREVLAFFHENYFGDLEGGVIEKLKISLEKVRREFNEHVEIAAVVDAEEVLYAGFFGGAKIYVKNKEKCGLLGGDSEEVGVRVFSAWKNLGTKLVLGTSNFWKRFGEGRIKGLLESERGSMEIAEELAVIIGSVEEGSGVGGVTVTVEETRESEQVELDTETVISREEVLKPVGRLEVGANNFWSQTKIRMMGNMRKARRIGKINFGIILMGILAVLIVGGGVWRHYKSQGSTKALESLTEIEEKLKEASLLADTNAVRAKEIVDEVKPTLLQSADKKNGKAEDLLSQVKTVEEAILGLVRLNFKEAVDLSLLRDGFVASQAKKADKNILVLDNNSGRLVVFDTEKETGSVVLGGETLTGTREMAFYPGFVYVAGAFGVKECATDSWKCTVKIEEGEVPGGITDLGVWGGNLYALDGQEGRIWKYTKKDSSFGKKVSWMDADTELVGGDNPQIDGKIWASFLNGGIGKYSQGVKEDFKVTGILEPGLGGGKLIYTSDEDTRLYVLDPKNKRIVVMDKSGTVQKQFTADILGNATGLVVYEDKARIYVTIGAKIYRAETP